MTYVYTWVGAGLNWRGGAFMGNDWVIARSSSPTTQARLDPGTHPGVPVAFSGGPMHRRMILVLALLFAACGGAKTSSTTTTTVAPTTVAPTTTVPVSTTVSPQTIKAQKANLQIEDFPDGWKATEDEPGSGLDIDRLWSEISQCLGITGPDNRPPRAVPDPTAKSPTFLRGLATQARSRVSYTSSGSVVTAALASPKAQDCMNAAFTGDTKRSAPQGAVPGPVTVKSAAPTPTLTAKGIGGGSTYKVTVTLTLGDTPETAPSGQKAQGPVDASGTLKIPLFHDYYVLVTPTSVVQLWFLNPGSDFPPDLERSLVDKVLSRV